MITEDYVSRETYNLLKEKGYNGKFKTCYDIKGYTYPAIHLYDAMKWLRDMFHLEIYPFHDAIQENNDWWYRIERHSKGCSLPEHESNVIYKTYEEACEEAIKYCLENLF